MVDHDMGPRVVRPKVHVAQVAASEVAEQSGARYAGVQGLGFAVAGNGQSL
jgi:hypothetical protein